MTGYESAAASRGLATPDLTIKFLGNEENYGYSKCVLELKLRDMSSWKQKWNIKEWTDATHRLNDRQARIKKNGDRIYHLVIQGRGHDGRCAWCRAFRSTIFKDFKEKSLRYQEYCACDFE